MLLISLFSVYGAGFSAEITAVKNRITADQEAEFKLTIHNNEAVLQTFRIKTPDQPRWFIFIMPMINPILVDVSANSDESINLFIDPNKRGTGAHLVNVDVISESTGEKITLQPRVAILTSTPVKPTYIPTVVLKTDFPAQINPNEELKFKITLSNQNKLDISKAKLTLSSKLINKETELNIPPKEETIVDLNLKLDPKTKPIKDKLTISLVYKDKNVFIPIVKKYEIVSYSDIVDIITVKKGFLTKTVNIVFTNKGNVQFRGELKLGVSTVKRLFGSAEPDAKVIEENGKHYYVWPTKLEPYESTTITVTENYLGIAVLLAAIVLIGVVIFLKRSPILIRKDVIEVDTDEGGLSQAKILINVKNRSLKKLKEISIIDKIPKLLDIDRHTILGSLKPTRIKHSSKHETLILWEIEELTPWEERVINYYIKSNLKILGGLTLQPAMAKFRWKEKQLKTRSNKVFIKI